MAAELNVAAISQSQAALVLQQQQQEQEQRAMEVNAQPPVGGNEPGSPEDERPGTPLEDEDPISASIVNGKEDNNGDTTGQLDDDDDSDEEENVNVVIKSNAATAPIGVMAAAAHQQHLGVGGAAVNSASAGAGGTVFKGGVGQLTGAGTRAVQHKASGVEIDMIPTVNGVLLTEMDLEALEDKPWRLPGADISDYFNYGFTEETWAAYCDRQRRLRAEASAKGLVIGNKLMTGGTNDHKTPQMIQTISRSDNFSEEQKSLLGPAVTANALGASMGLGAPPVVASSVASVVSAITSSSTINDMTSFMNAAAAADAKSAAAVANAVSASSGNSALSNVLANSIPKLGSDPGSMLPPPFMPPGMPPMPPPFGLPPFPGMPSGPPPGFPGMPPGFPGFPPAAAIPANAPSTANSNNRNPVAEIEFKTEPPSTPPPEDFAKAVAEDEIITMKEYKKRERERDHRDHSPRERESKRRHHRERDRDRDRERDRSEERGRRRRGGGGHSDEDSTTGGTSTVAASSSEDKKTYKRSSKRHHKDHHRDHHRSRSRDRTPTNDE